MRLQCLGLSHHTADVALREKLASVETSFPSLFDSSSRDFDGISELVVLSTCNRVELYSVSQSPSFSILEQLITQHNDLSAEDIAGCMYRMVDLQVASHLFRVAAGLDSMVLGEPQILGQITRAYESAHRAGNAGKILSRLFQMAIHAGKRVRTETDLGKHSTSVPAIAAKLAMQRHADFSKTKIVLLGAGEMAELAIDALRKRGARNFQVVSRSLARACKLADRWMGEASTMDGLLGSMSDADVLITSSSAPHSLINKDFAMQAMSSRPDRPLVIIDIAVPRDVEADVGTVPNIHLYDIDGLNRDMDEGIRARQYEVPRVEAILSEEYLKFKKYIDSLAVVPFIVQLRDHTEAIRRKEFEKALRRLGGLSQEQEEQINTLTRSIVNKILHKPTIKLHDASQSSETAHYLEAAKILFGLDPTKEPELEGRIDP